DSLKTGKAHWLFVGAAAERDGPDSLPALALAAGMKTVLAFPVLSGDEVVAMLRFAARKEEAPSEAFLGVMKDVSDQIARVSERYRAAEAMRRHADELRETNAALARKNAALEEVLSTLDESKRQAGDEVVANVEKVILPMLRSLRPGLSAKQSRVLGQVEASLAELTGPFVAALGKEFAALSPTEVRICNHIRAGLLTKQIAQVEGISSGTVSRHREGIRRKLGLAHTGANLTTFLQEFGGQA
ncbi:MAG: LuxR C-terminal-related transcriptional regulator, partial [Planctomycetota bacterium]